MPVGCYPCPRTPVTHVSRTNTTVNEYLSANGTVFAVSWRGPRPPDLSQLLGPYFAEYQTAAASPHAQRGHLLSRPKPLWSRVVVTCATCGAAPTFLLCCRRESARMRSNEVVAADWVVLSRRPFGRLRWRWLLPLPHQSVSSPTVAAANVQPISVNPGPEGDYSNGLFTSVILCVPGTSNCQTVNDILLDTGSFGLRILASALTLSLPGQVDASGNPIGECVPFVKSFTWGPVEARASRWPAKAQATCPCS